MISHKNCKNSNSLMGSLSKTLKCIFIYIWILMSHWPPLNGTTKWTDVIQIFTMPRWVKCVYYQVKFQQHSVLSLVDVSITCLEDGKVYLVPCPHCVTSSSFALCDLKFFNFLWSGKARSIVTCCVVGVIMQFRVDLNYRYAHYFLCCSKSQVFDWVGIWPNTRFYPNF